MHLACTEPMRAPFKLHKHLLFHTHTLQGTIKLHVDLWSFLSRHVYVRFGLKHVLLQRLSQPASISSQDLSNYCGGRRNKKGHKIPPSWLLKGMRVSEQGALQPCKLAGESARKVVFSSVPPTNKPKKSLNKKAYVFFPYHRFGLR